MNDEWTEIQTQLSFQEDTLQTLNEIVTRQQKDIDYLTLAIEQLNEQFQTMQATDKEEKKPALY